MRLLIALMFLPQMAEADIFDRMTGLFGAPDLASESCAVNPVFSSFSLDRGRVNFAWGQPVPSYSGAMITAYGGTVMRFDDQGIIMLRDDETRMTDAGQPVLWQMRETADPDGYCWHRLDWPPDICLQLVRCLSDANS